jgi:hypothetical protein
MNRIFIEAEKEETSECNFLKALISKHFPEAEVEYVPMRGVDNLFNESNLNHMRIAADEGDNVIVLLDADTEEKGWGFAKRQKNVTDKMVSHDVLFPFFLYPNNHDDGDVELLMQSIARTDLHKGWWDCFNDYEACVRGIQDTNGEQKYMIPNRKAKLHTYISSQRLSRKVRDKLGVGNWLFDDENYWNMESQKLKPLLDFLNAHIVKPIK